jgi:hypothetical protein
MKKTGQIANSNEKTLTAVADGRSCAENELQVVEALK